jgi:catalase
MAKRKEELNDKIADLKKNTEDGTDQFLTTDQGLRINDDQNSLKSGERGPSLLEDFILREKITHFDHERIPERVVHARGAAAHGFFQVYKSMAPLTKRSFQDPSVKRSRYSYASTVVDRVVHRIWRDVRGFAVKFCTEDGNYDLVGNNIPVFSSKTRSFPILSMPSSLSPITKCTGIRPRHTGLSLMRSRCQSCR